MAIKDLPAWTSRLLPRHVFLLLLAQMCLSLVLGVACVLLWPTALVTPQFVIVTEVVAILAPALLLLQWLQVRPFQVLPLGQVQAPAVAETAVLVVGLAVLLNVANHLLYVFLPMAVQNFNPMADLLDNLQLDDLLHWALFIVATTIVPALCEEFSFRGVIQPILIGRLGAAAGIVSTSLLFAVIHFDPARFGVHLALGLLFGYLCWGTGSLIPAVLGHALANASALFLVNSLEASLWLPLWLALLGAMAAAGVAGLELHHRRPLWGLAMAASIMLLAGAEALTADLSPMISLVRAQEHINQGQDAEAIADLRHSIQLNPAFAPGYNYLANLYATTKNRPHRHPAEAIRLATVAVELTDRRNVHFLATLAHAYYEGGDYSHALSTWQETLGLNPNQRDAQQGMKEARLRLDASPR